MEDISKASIKIVKNNNKSEKCLEKNQVLSWKLNIQTKVLELNMSYKKGKKEIYVIYN